jgi:hypothetical protein
MVPLMIPQVHPETQKYYTPRMYSVGVQPPPDPLSEMIENEEDSNISPFLPLGTVIRNIATMLPLGDPPSPPSADVNNLMDEIVDDDV